MNVRFKMSVSRLDVFLCFVSFACSSAFLDEVFKDYETYNKYDIYFHPGRQDQDISHTGLGHGDTENSTICDHPDQRNHILELIEEWHRNNDYKAVVRVYDWTVVHQKIYVAAVLGKRESLHAEAYENGKPDFRRIEFMIKYNINAVCREDIMNYITQMNLMSPNGQATPTSPSNTYPASTKSTISTSGVKQTTMTPASQSATSETLLTTPTRPNITINHTCSSLKSVTALARGSILKHPAAGLCTDGSHSQSEALLLDSCSAPQPIKWKQGPNVVQNCESIPPYTPVATFTFGHYALDGSHLSGIFVDCTDKGFKAILQLCGVGPQAYELVSTSSVARQNALSYYVVDW